MLSRCDYDSRHSAPTGDYGRPHSAVTGDYGRPHSAVTGDYGMPHSAVNDFLNVNNRSLCANYTTYARQT